MPYGYVRMTVFLRGQSDAEGLLLHHLCKAELDQDDHLYASRLWCPSVQVRTSAMAVPQRQSPFATSADTYCHQHWRVSCTKLTLVIEPKTDCFWLVVDI